MQSPYFSLVMPAYNCDNTISTTIKSIQEQTFQDFELIIVNDGSTDNTEDLIKKHLAEDKRIHLITTENNGPGSARNIGITKASGKYLYFLDADDSLPRETLQFFVEIIKDDTVDLVVSSYKLIVMDKGNSVEEKIVGVNQDQLIASNENFMREIYPLMEKQLLYVIWNKVYKLDIVKSNQIKFPSYKSCEDRLFNIQYFHYVNKVFLTKEVTYHYSFEGKRSLTNKFLPNKFETFEEFYLELLKLTTENIEGSSALFIKGVMSCIIPFHSQECSYSYREKIKEIKNILNNKTVEYAVKYSSTDSIMRKLFKLLFRSKSAYLNYYATKFMFHISNLSPKTIEKLKGNF